MNVQEFLSNASYSDIKSLWHLHNEWAKTNNRLRGEPVWFDSHNTLNVIGVRCNSENDFNFGKYNDYLLLIFNKPDETFTRVLLNVTNDPAKNSNGIAHLRQGVWNSYVVRPHRWASRTFPKIGYQQRWALCQDKHTVEIVRTDGNGKVISTERGMYGINIHCSGGYHDSSLGCTIIKDDISYVDMFLPLIYNIKTQQKVPTNHSNITYCLINHLQLEKYVGTLAKVEKAETVEGSDVISGGAKGATKIK